MPSQAMSLSGRYVVCIYESGFNLHISRLHGRILTKFITIIHAAKAVEISIVSYPQPQNGLELT